MFLVFDMTLTGIHALSIKGGKVGNPYPISMANYSFSGPTQDPICQGGSLFLRLVVFSGYVKVAV